DAGTVTGTPYNSLNENTNGTEGFEEIDITWNYFVPDPANPVFLVVYTTNDEDCDNDNIDYYIIEPVHSFTLDVAGIDMNGVIEGEDGYIPGPCAAPVNSAVWDATAQELQMNYGVNYLYFIVT